MPRSPEDIRLIADNLLTRYEQEFGTDLPPQVLASIAQAIQAEISERIVRGVIGHLSVGDLLEVVKAVDSRREERKAQEQARSGANEKAPADVGLGQAEEPVRAKPAPRKKVR